MATTAVSLNEMVSGS